MKIPLVILNELKDFALPEGLTIEENDDDDGALLVVASDADVKSIKAEFEGT